ncbi:hypothetical protein VTI74DRAFT_7701 [Chaetomium olivicolor]
MDDAARLVSDLHGKLAELDGKVAAYQRDMLAEFHKHMEDCLKKYPDHVSIEVSRVIVESMSAGRYPALSPTTRVPDSLAVDRTAGDGRKSPPPVLRHTSGIPKEGPRSPHARETEFQGLFTPTYLPLLESNERLFRRPSAMPSPPTSGEPPLPLSTENVKKVDINETPKTAADQARPAPIRRLTDGSTSSVGSSGSDSKVRRSALRRSSGSHKGSPRRVRFEFEGEEVFPAGSPPKPSPSITIPDTPASGAEPQPPQAEMPAVVTEPDESTEYVGTSLLDVEGEEDLLPRPKKVSSTQALQVLTRSPLEEGTTWTVVNPDPEELAKMNGAKLPESAQSLPGSRVDSQSTIRADDGEDEPGNGELGSPIEELTKYEDDDNVSDEEFLSMRPKKKTPPPTAQEPFPKPRPQASTSSSKAHASAANGTPSPNEDQDPFFDLDDAAPRDKQPAKYLPDLDDSEDDATPGRLRSLARDQVAQAEGEASSWLPPVSPSAVLFGHSIGSYMGRSLTTNPIKDPKLYDEIAGMKYVHFFVGSVDGRSGVEAADMGSYRAASLVKGGGGVGLGATPRSFSERLALEEEMERRRVAGEDEDK